MIARRCTQCGETQKEALFWTVAAWNRADGERVAYKHKLGLDCVAAKIAPLQVHSDTNVMTCPNCGMNTSADFDAVFITWIPKGLGEYKIEAPFCGVCAANFRSWFISGATKLEDRPPLSRGLESAPRPTANQILASMGIEPRA